MPMNGTVPIETAVKRRMKFLGRKSDFIGRTVCVPRFIGIFLRDAIERHCRKFEGDSFGEFRSVLCPNGRCGAEKKRGK